MENFVAKLPDFLKPWGTEMLLRYVDFQGTTDRKTFWITILTDFILNIIVFAVALIPFIGKIISLAFGFGLMVPRLAMHIRRLKDTGKAWGYIFLVLVPFAGPIILLVFFCQNGTNA